METRNASLQTRNAKRETRNDGIVVAAHRGNAAARVDWIDRSHQFAVRIIKMVARLPKTPAGRTVANQIVRSAPSIVMNLEEAKGALTQKDTLHKTGIARREARETLRWLLLIRDAQLLPASKLELLINESDELVAMLTAGCKRLQEQLKQD
jgi:four helix bundle protein